MRTCPSCHRQIANNARFCPTCNHDFVADREKEAHQRVIGYVVLAVALAVALFIILLPGIIINACRGRYRLRSGNIIMTAIRDWQTWAISLPIAALLAVVLNACGVFDSAHKAAASPSATAAQRSDYDRQGDRPNERVAANLDAAQAVSQIAPTKPRNEAVNSQQEMRRAAEGFDASRAAPSTANETMEVRRAINGQATADEQRTRQSPSESIIELSPEAVVTDVFDKDLRKTAKNFQKHYSGKVVRYTETVARKNARERLLIFKGGGFMTSAYDVQVSLDEEWERGFDNVPVGRRLTIIGKLDRIVPPPFGIGSNSIRITGAQITMGNGALRDSQTAHPVFDKNGDVYRVVGIPDDDVLNVRAAPGMNSKTSFTLSNGEAVQVKGGSVFNGDTEWIPITAGSQQGWVRNKYVQRESKPIPTVVDAPPPENAPPQAPTPEPPNKSVTTRLTASEINSWPIDRVQFAIDEIYGRYGAEFGNQKTQAWADHQPWYHRVPGRTTDAAEQLFTDNEKFNIEILAARRDALRAPTNGRR